MDAFSQYTARANRFEKLRDSLSIQLNRSSNLRLLTGVMGAAAAGWFFWRRRNTEGLLLLLITAILFVILVIRHHHLKSSLQKAELFSKVNRDSLRRGAGAWTAFEDTGAEFIDEDHNYAGDLDIFGQNSLFQWINTAVTYLGRMTMKEWLTNPLTAKEDIIKRQSAVQELSERLDWRQAFQVEALLAGESMHDPASLFQWAAQQQVFYSRTLVKGTVKCLPILTGVSLLGTFLVPVIPVFVPVLLLCAQIGVLALRFSEMNLLLNRMGPYVNNIKAYHRMLKAFETQSFDSEPLRELQRSLQNTKQASAYQQVRELEGIMDRISIRYSELYLVINILLLWDYQCLIALEEWKRRSGALLELWIRTLGEVEALASLSILPFDHPDWAYPILHQEDPRLFAVSLGHPLLTKERICNDIPMMREGQVALITGSNMSGKSTLLRTVGINLVLACLGAPVCAREFHCTPFRMYTSMRIRDDLERNISSFYAELLRIQRMIEAAQRGEPVFFLLDEIFRGTNSRDRHTGARVLIKQLSREGAIGFVSTHDVELGDLSAQNPRIRNYHFREDYREGQLTFDYKLHPGVSNTRNAIYLMKMAGVTVPADEE